jgi:hypothetical protein
MPKEILVDPSQVLRPGRVETPALQVHAYARTMAAEVAARGAPR